MGNLILLSFLAGLFWLIRRDIARRDGVSAAIWIPTLWVGVLASRPFSTWLGIDGGSGTYEYSLEGSPADRYFFIFMIFGAFFVLSQRRMSWSALAKANWPIFLFYSYLFLSVLWADDTIVSFKRWFKDFGNIAVAMVILTEINPLQAVRAVFVRCAYLLIPLSIIYIRYFPNLGRRYNIHSGMMEATGVTFQKNSLGAMVMVCGLVLIWDWFERGQNKRVKDGVIETFLPILILAMGGWLLLTSDSKTSMLCLAMGGCIIAGTRLPFVRRYVGSLGRYAIVGILVVFTLDWMFGIKEAILASMGRDLTFTGRTDVWRVLLALNTDPIFGTGFCSFWSDEHYRSQLPYWVAYSAHNGYLEAYLDGGMIGVTLLVTMLLTTGAKINRQLAVAGNYAVVRFAVLLVAIIGDFSESHFGRIGPVWFTLLLCSLDAPRPIVTIPVQQPADSDPIPQDQTVPSRP